MRSVTLLREEASETKGNRITPVLFASDAVPFAHHILRGLVGETQR
jgi:hypothetical protein